MQQPAPAKTNVSYFGQATSLISATLPMLGVNMAVYAAFFVVSVIWFAVWGGLAIVLGKAVPLLAYICLIVALGAGGGLVRFARRYLLYMVKGAHIAAMTEIIKGRQVPGGLAQLHYGRGIIERHFKDVSMLFGLDMLIDGTLKAISRRIINFTSWLPLPDAARQVVRIITEILNRSLSYVDEAILSYAIYREEENVWNSARHGIVLYGQSYKPILITSAKVYLLGKVIYFAMLAMLFVPGYFILSFASDYFVVQLIVLVGIFTAAYLVQLALFEPFALAYVMVTYHHTIAGKTPDPEWDQRLQNLSDSFKQIVQKAGSWVSGNKQPAAQQQPFGQPQQQQFGQPQ